MKRLSVTDHCVFGQNRSDMVARALGNKFDNNDDRCYVDLGDSIAWFVYMNGNKHGYYPSWEWRNYLTSKSVPKNQIVDNGDIIREYLASADTKQLYQHQAENGFYPYRLAFRLDPLESGNPNSKYCCKFVGAYVLDCFLNKELTAMQYVKVMDEYVLGWKGDFGKIINNKEDFIQSNSKYYTPIENMDFSVDILRKLKNANFNYLYELLEFPHGTGPLAHEIRERLFSYLKDN